MTTSKFRIESGIQMLVRLSKRPDIEHFYPTLFKSGMKPGQSIELYSDNDLSCIMCDIISESIIPLEFGGKGAGVVIFDTDGKFNFDCLLKILKEKLVIQLNDLSLLEGILLEALKIFHIIDIYNSTQFRTTIHTLENILINHPNISLIVFHTLTAFYWSEYNFKIVKMDLYIKSLQKMIQNVIKDYKVVMLYTRPKNFSSTKESIENLETCHEMSSLEQLNYRVHVVYTEEGTHHAEVRTYNDLYKVSFKILNDRIVWL